MIVQGPVKKQQPDGMSHRAVPQHPPTHPPGTPPPPNLRDWVKFSSGPSADQIFSVAPLAPICLDQNRPKNSAPLGGGVDPPTPTHSPLKGALSLTNGLLQMLVVLGSS